MLKKEKWFFIKIFKKVGMLNKITITTILITVIGIILYGVSHFNKKYNDTKFLLELPDVKTATELLLKAENNGYDYVWYNNGKSVDNMIKQVKNATPNVWNGGNINNDGNRIVLYNPDVSSGDLTQNNNDVLKNAIGYVIFLKNRKFSKKIAGLYNYYGYVSGYNIYDVKKNIPLMLWNILDNLNVWSGSDVNDNYNNTTGNNY